MFIRNGLLLCFLPAGLAAPSGIGGEADWLMSARTSQVSAEKRGNAAVAYFLDNDPSGSSIVSLEIGSNGLLTKPVKTPTHGRGSIQVNGTGFPVTTDGLGSQGAVHVAHDMLFTVNAGSNTVSLFTIDPQDPSTPKLVSSPADTLGDFPISVDYSKKLNKACVLNGGARAGVTCFTVDREKGLIADGALRALPKSIINETTPSSGPPGSAAQVLFNPESTAVFATIKGNAGSDPVKLGSLVAWPVEDDGCISSSSPIVTQIDGVAMNFGFQFLSESRILMADPSFGASLLDVHPNNMATQIAHTILPGQHAVCWTASEPQLNTLYAIDAGQNLVYTLNGTTGALSGTFTVHNPVSTAANAGLYDNAIYQGKMYVLAGTNGVLVIGLTERKTLQYLDLSAVGERRHYQGMAVWA